MRPNIASVSKHQNGRWSVPTETAAVSKLQSAHLRLYGFIQSVYNRDSMFGRRVALWQPRIVYVWLAHWTTKSLTFPESSSHLTTTHIQLLSLKMLLYLRENKTKLAFSDTAGGAVCLQSYSIFLRLFCFYLFIGSRLAVLSKLIQFPH